MTTTDPNSFLMQTSVKSFKFAAFGDVAKGTITALDMQQQRDMDGNQKWWDEAKTQAMMQLRVVLQTGLAEDADDDGLRAVYVKGQMQQAVREAIKAAATSKIEVGGTLAVQYVSDGEPPKKGLNPPKQYRAKYEPPTATTTAVDADDLF